MGKKIRLAFDRGTYHTALHAASTCVKSTATRTNQLLHRRACKCRDVDMHLQPFSRLPLNVEHTCMQVGQQALFAAELYAWFCVGEVIGRGGSLAGYKI